MVIQEQTNIDMPVQGGIYQLKVSKIQVLAIGRYENRDIVVSQVVGTSKLTLWPMEYWLIEYKEAQLILVDKNITDKTIRGCGSWLGHGCLVLQVDDEVSFTEMEIYNEEL